MIAVRVVNTYPSRDQAYMARVNTEYSLTAREQEVLDLCVLLNNESKVQGEGWHLPPLHALSVLPDPDPLFVRFLTDDLFDLVDGKIVGTHPSYQAVLDTFEGWWS